jgi:hypothetical protein
LQVVPRGCNAGIAAIRADAAVQAGGQGRGASQHESGAYRETDPSCQSPIDRAGKP